MVVYAPTDGEYRAVAEAVADDRGERVVSALQSVEDPTAPVIYVGAPGDVSASDLLFLQERLCRKGPADAAFGVVTGLTPESARDLYFERQSGDDHVVVTDKQLPEGLEFGPHTTGVTGSVSADRVASLADRRLESCSLETHGWSIHLTLSDGYVCGVPESLDVAAFEGPHPACVEDGERDCPLDGELVSAERLDAAHVFLGSCVSMIDNNLHGLPVHVGLGLLDGADSLVGAYRPAATHPIEAVLHHALLRAGYDLIERCYVLLRNSHVNSIMAYPYVPFGDPDATSARAVDPSYDATVERDGDRTLVRATDVDAHVVDVTIPDERVAPTDDRYYAWTSESDYSESPLCYTAFEVEDGVRLVVYAGDRITASSLELVVSPAPVASETRRVARDSLRRASASRDFNLLSGSATDQFDGLWHQVHDFPEKVSNEGYDATVAESVREEVERPFGNVRALKRHLLDIASEGFRLSDKYRTRAVDDDVFPEARACPVCGSRVFVKQVGDGTGTRRAIGHCTRCGPIYDVPTTAGDRSPPRPTLLVDSDREETVRTVTVEFRNPADVEMRTAIRPFRVGAGTETEEGESFFDPVTVETTLAPGERVEADFELDTGLVDTAKAHLGASVVGNLSAFEATVWLQQ